MPHHNTVFRQVAQHIPWAKLQRSIAAHRADKGVRKLFTKDLVQVLLFAQLAGAHGLRDITATLASQDARRYHSGLAHVARSTLADALATRPAAVVTELLDAIIPRVAAKLARSLGEGVRLIDSTTVKLSRAAAGWARFSAQFCGAKAHVVFDPDANCPLFLAVTPARVNDITPAKAMPIEPGATYVFDLGYYDYAWWAALDTAGCRFVSRLKANTPLDIVQTRPVPPTAPGVRADRIGHLPARLARARRNPIGRPIREITVEIKPGTVLRLVSNDLDAPASEIAALYKRRWDIELFFRWIKQGLELRHFFGTSENAVRIQIAVALVAFALVRLAHGTQRAAATLTQFARLIRANILHRQTLDQLQPTRAGPAPPPQTCLAQAILL